MTVRAARFRFLSARAVQQGYRDGLFTPLEVVTELLDAIDAEDPFLGCFVALDREAVLAAAARTTSLIARGAGDDMALLGLPVAVKDMIDTQDLVTAYGSSIFSGHRPASDAAVVRKLRDAGAIVIGKTATHEFAWGFTTANPHYGPTRNPWGPDRIPGGSSGGSAAALAAGFVPLAIGTDTGGSIRVPSAFCGVCGHKPTHGLVSVDGVFPLAPSLDHVGPMARSPDDLALLLQAILDGPLGAIPALRGMRIGVSAELHRPEPRADIGAVWRQACETVASAGAAIVELPRVDLSDLPQIFSTTLLPEALAVHRDAGLFPKYLAQYGPDVARRFALAAQLDATEIAAAQQRRFAMVAEFDAMFDHVDVIMSLCSAEPPGLIDELFGPNADSACDPRHYVIGYTALADLIGFPATAVRGGFDRDGLPVGIQFMARRGNDVAALGAAAGIFERTHDLQSRRVGSRD